MGNTEQCWQVLEEKHLAIILKRSANRVLCITRNTKFKRWRAKQCRTDFRPLYSVRIDVCCYQHNSFKFRHHNQKVGEKWILLGSNQCLKSESLIARPACWKVSRPRQFRLEAFVRSNVSNRNRNHKRSNCSVRGTLHSG